MEYIIGVADGHDAGAALVDMKGTIHFAASEERFTRIKHQRGVPLHTLKHIKKYLQKLDQEDAVKAIAIGGIFRKEKRLKELVKAISYYFPRRPIVFIDHHLCHAASAFYTSGFQDAVIITLDAAGDGLSGSISVGKASSITTFQNFSYLDSIGDYFAGITEALGYKPMSDEHKVASMAAYANGTNLLEEMKALIDYDPKSLTFRNHLGVIGHRATKEILKRIKGLDPFEVAAAAQRWLETMVLRLIKDVLNTYPAKYLCFSGGVAGNVQLNMKIRNLAEIEDMWVFPHMGDGGLCVGAALELVTRYNKIDGAQNRYPRLSNLYLGPAFSEKDIMDAYSPFANTVQLKKVAPEDVIPKLLDQNLFVGLVNGRMEFGPRALGNRSLLANPTISQNQRLLNKRKGRPWFQPFAPTILYEYCPQYLENAFHSPFMTFAFRVTDVFAHSYPAVTHKDHTTRPQTLKNENQAFRSIIKNLSDMLGFNAVLNTSLNLHGEPIVNSPSDSLLVLKKRLIDALLINDYLIKISV